MYGESHKHAVGTRKLSSLVISMLMSILQNVGTYTGRAYENSCMGSLISTLLHGTRKLSSFVISMLMSIFRLLQKSISDFAMLFSPSGLWPKVYQISLYF
jgi:hypothetical protein